jgi:uncharacterized protein (DUF2252 family)
MKEEPSKSGKGLEQAYAAQFEGLTPHRSRAERYAMGKRLRETCPRNAHAGWKAPADRPDPVRLVLEANQGRIPELLPLRHGRMVRSPFTFYRGAALNMAVDLAATPATGIRVQCGGDAHLVNFRGFSTPERRVILALNDLDETLPAPWEWDVKRLGASFVIACRDNGLSASTATEVVLTCARTYRERMAEFSAMKVLDLWYYAIDTEMLFPTIKDPKIRRRALQRVQKERGRSVAEDLFPKLVQEKDGRPVIKDQAPLIYHPPYVKNLPKIKEVYAGYRDSLAPAHRVLLERYEFKDAAIKVVGVGSVGTACLVTLLMAGDGDPLVLQVKEARASVLEAYAGKSVFANHGQRVVNGLRLMQPASDIFLGWTHGASGRHYYVRQLRDVKIIFAVETYRKAEMTLFAQMCGWSLALSHARSGDPAVISGYLGKSDAFDKALAAFSVAYADQTEKDHAALKRAVRDGKIKAFVEETK